MSHCHALTKDNKRCRGLATILSKTKESITYSHTCHRHTTFFDTFQPTEELIEDLEYSTCLRIFFREALREGLICVKGLIESLPALSCYSYFYLVCVNNCKGFQSSWNPGLHTETYRMVWERLHSAGPVFITYKHLFLLASLDGVAGIYEMLSLFPQNSILGEPWFTFMDRLMKTEFFEQMFHADDTVHEAYIERTIKKLKQNTTTLLTILESGMFIKWMKNKKERKYSYMRNKISPFKDELIEVAWEPSRIRWIMDEGQKARLKSEKHRA